MTSDNSKTPARAPGRLVRVHPHPKGWAVTREGNIRPSRVAATRERALHIARAYAREERTELVVEETPTTSATNGPTAASGETSRGAAGSAERPEPDGGREQPAQTGLRDDASRTSTRP
jgi:hypothetical protein